MMYGWSIVHCLPASMAEQPSAAIGTVIRAKTQGVAHPVLPCGAKLYITYNGKHVLTQVIDRGPSGTGPQFELTDALARLVGLTGTQRIRWSYAAAEPGG